MPTGYTAIIQEGADFKTFALRAARGMGALIMMRDEPDDAPLPEKFEPSEYYLNKLEETKQALKDFNSKTNEELQFQWREEMIEESEKYRRWNRQNDELRKKYENMLLQVRLYNPPSENHVGFKAFMESQIVESINFDCTKHQIPEPISFPEWKVSKLAQLEKSLQYYTEEHDKEVQRTNDRNVWLNQLKYSLGI